MHTIDYTSYRAVKGFGRRVRTLVIHYTAANFASSVAALAGNGGVSAHYLVPDPHDSTYAGAGFEGVRIFNLVDEQERAWHAGRSAWAGRSNLNDTSIGIELVNQARDSRDGIVFEPYLPEQIDALVSLALNILQRYPDIVPTQVVGHSDVSPGRKSDPGPLFPWETLYKAGVGAWYDEATKSRHWAAFEGGLPTTRQVVAMLAQYGYDTGTASTDAGLRQLLRAFQMHFRPSRHDGMLDRETAAILYALVEKYV
ncbi:N-acetylmuramoyl-L-alanine amidase [Pseudomonas sp. GD03860]|uniref:N-acetylmuramoyl-L-alanine amidase n=1 Tax=Pseudomonas TaxID=286 RepID=UPI002363F35D|nr:MULTISPECIES: N-acetylmuramoyl-L-alanine amidase [Pseudomonas]MDD2058817.1 N-acetylmuramoyl-L-alanine amidase [Pseudomonas putida]MDH0637050.1 N-acetylmuramoyl-L-alanine amidase [Pseudomonas sp. GD03860]